jgi:hypothetical protein
MPTADENLQAALNALKTPLTELRDNIARTNGLDLPYKPVLR